MPLATFEVCHHATKPEAPRNGGHGSCEAGRGHDVALKKLKMSSFYR